MPALLTAAHRRHQSLLTPLLLAFAAFAAPTPPPTTARPTPPPTAPTLAPTPFPTSQPLTSRPTRLPTAEPTAGRPIDRARHCVFLHGVGMLGAGPTGANLSAVDVPMYWGGEKHLKRSRVGRFCRTYAFVNADTTTQGWDAPDRALQRLYCAAATSGPSSSSRTIRDTFVVTHSEGNLILAAAIANGMCGLDRTTADWFSLAAPWGGAKVAAVLGDVCTLSKIRPQWRGTVSGFLSKQNFCTGTAPSPGYASLVPARGKLGDGALAKVARQHLSGALCGTSAIGLPSEVSGVWLGIAAVSRFGPELNDGLVGLSSCQYGPMLDLPWNTTSRSKWYLSEINHYDSTLRTSSDGARAVARGVSAAVPYLMNELPPAPLPAFPTFLASGFDCDLKNVVCGDFHINNVSFSMIVPSIGTGDPELFLGIHGLTVACHGDWAFELDDWPHIPYGSGIVKVTVGDKTAADAGIEFLGGDDSGDALTIHAINCEVDVVIDKLDFSGGMSAALIDAFSSRISRAIEDNVKSRVCRAVDRLIEREAYKIVERVEKLQNAVTMQELEDARSPEAQQPVPWLAIQMAHAVALDVEELEVEETLKLGMAHEDFFVAIVFGVGLLCVALLVALRLVARRESLRIAAAIEAEAHMVRKPRLGKTMPAGTSTGGGGRDVEMSSFGLGRQQDEDAGDIGRGGEAKRRHAASARGGGRRRARPRTGEGAPPSPSNNMHARLQLRDIVVTAAHGGKRKKHRVILDRANLSFEPGKLSAIMGASGAGKSTLLRAASMRSEAGLRVSGEIRLGTTPVRAGTAKAEAFLRGVGFVPQQLDLAIDPALTAAENLYFHARIRWDLSTAAQFARQDGFPMRRSNACLPCGKTTSTATGARTRTRTREMGASRATHHGRSSKSSTSRAGSGRGRGRGRERGRGRATSSLFGASADPMLALVSSTLRVFGLLPHAATPAHQLSGGQRRRLAIAVECLRPAPILFLDEPTTGQDASTALEIVKLLRRIAQGKLGAGDGDGAQAQPKIVVMAVHQPRQEIWDLIDAVAVLGVGPSGAGVVVRSGSTSVLGRQSAAAAATAAAAAAASTAECEKGSSNGVRNHNLEEARATHDDGFMDRESLATLVDKRLSGVVEGWRLRHGREPSAKEVASMRRKLSMVLKFKTRDLDAETGARVAAMTNEADVVVDNVAALSPSEVKASADAHRSAFLRGAMSFKHMGIDVDGENIDGEFGGAGSGEESSSSSGRVAVLGRLAPTSDRLWATAIRYAWKQPLWSDFRLLFVLPIMLSLLIAMPCQSGRPEASELVAMVAAMSNFGPGVFGNLVRDGPVSLLNLRAMRWLQRRRVLTAFAEGAVTLIMLFARCTVFGVLVAFPALALGLRSYATPIMFLHTSAFIIVSTALSSVMLYNASVYITLSQQLLSKQLTRHQVMMTACNLWFAMGFVYGGFMYRVEKLPGYFRLIAFASYGYWTGMGILASILPGLNLPCQFDLNAVQSSADTVGKQITAASLNTASAAGDAASAEWTSLVQGLTPAMHVAAQSCHGDAIFASYVEESARPLMPATAILVLLCYTFGMSVLAFAILLKQPSGTSHCHSQAAVQEEGVLSACLRVFHASVAQLIDCCCATSRATTRRRRRSGGSASNSGSSSKKKKYKVMGTAAETGSRSRSNSSRGLLGRMDMGDEDEDEGDHLGLSLSVPSPSSSSNSSQTQDRHEAVSV